MVAAATGAKGAALGGSAGGAAGAGSSGLLLPAVGEVVQIDHGGVERSNADVEEVVAYEPPLPGEELCEVCGSGDGNASMLLCDKCSCGFHMYCLSPPLHAVPAGEWLCSACLQESFGFGSGRVFKYHQYERQAHAFKQSFFAELFETEAARFSKKSKSAAMAAAYSAEERSRIAARLTELEVPPEEVEWQFWNIVTTPSKSLEVLYGSDLPVISP